MSEIQATPFGTKVQILADFWLNYRNDEELQDFIEYNDIALPLSFFIDNKLVTKYTDVAKSFIEEAFDLLLQALDIEEDTGFETLNDLLSFE